MDIDFQRNNDTDVSFTDDLIFPSDYLDCEHEVTLEEAATGVLLEVDMTKTDSRYKVCNAIKILLLSITHLKSKIMYKI